MKSTRRGLTLIETLVAGVVLGLGLFVVAEGTRYVRNQAKTQRTWELLARLDRSLVAYYEAGGCWPEPSSALPADDRRPQTAPTDDQPAAKAEPAGGLSDDQAAKPDMSEAAMTGDLSDGSERVAGEIVALLAHVPASRAILEGVEWETARDAAGPRIRDSWARPLRCLTARSPTVAQRQAVAANGGRPIFISGGPDGFGSDPPGTAGLWSNGLPR